MSASALKFDKGRPKLLERREQKARVEGINRMERQKCRVRSGGQCEVIEQFNGPADDQNYSEWLARRCARRASQNHHLIGGTGRRNKGRSILAAHRLDTCDRCHDEITNHVLVPVDGLSKEDAATVRYERVK